MQIKLFNSGASCHISPYHDAFTKFESIPPHPLCAANKEMFCASGKGEIILDLLNGVNTSQLCLTEVLYSPEVGYTLVSIRCLDEARFSTTLMGNASFRTGAVHT
jgi:hypothetical protein